MKKLLVALIVGLAAGYHWGYDEARDGKPSIANRALDKFGVSKFRAVQEAHDKRIDEASKP